MSYATFKFDGLVVNAENEAQGNPGIQVGFQDVYAWSIQKNAGC